MFKSSNLILNGIGEAAREKAAELCEGGFTSLRVTVVGDLMIDRYIIGSVDRISPEAPVPIIKFKSERDVLGGACNSAMNIAGLGAKVSLVGRIGADDSGLTLLNLTREAGFEEGVIVRKGTTSVKTRIMGDGIHHLLRLDKEDIAETSEAEANDIVAEVRNMKTDCMIISDYGKGFCSPAMCRQIISYCNEAGIPVFVDPKKADWSCYSGAFVVTPNVKELSAAVGRSLENEDDAVVDAARELLARYSIQNILVTRSEKGATVVTDDSSTHIGTTPVEVFDVSGAGDTSVAVLSLFCTAGFSLEDSARLANAASQIVIGKVGTYAIKAREMLSLLNAEISHHKIADVDEAARYCSESKAQGEKVVFTNGCFDILHEGHINCIIAAKKLGDKLIVGLNSDASVRRLKGEKRPVNGQKARAIVLAALEAVDLVVIFDEDTPAEILSRIRPNIIAKGGDYSPEQVAGREYADEVAIIPLTEGFSTTETIEKIRNE